MKDHVRLYLCFVLPPDPRSSVRTGHLVTSYVPWKVTSRYLRTVPAGGAILGSSCKPAWDRVTEAAHWSCSTSVLSYFRLLFALSQIMPWFKSKSVLDGHAWCLVAAYVSGYWCRQDRECWIQRLPMARHIYILSHRHIERMMVFDTCSLPPQGCCLYDCMLRLTPWGLSHLTVAYLANAFVSSVCVFIQCHPTRNKSSYSIILLPLVSYLV